MYLVSMFQPVLYVPKCVKGDNFAVLHAGVNRINGANLEAPCVQLSSNSLVAFTTAMTTLPPFLFDTHKRYKEDTNRVPTWLAETAQKCGYYCLNAGAHESRPSGRLKGKARKEAREKQKAEAAETIPSAVRYTIPVNEFTGLAH